MSKIETAETLNELADAIKELHESQKTKKGSLDEIAEFCRNLTSFTAMESLPKKHGIYEKAKEILVKKNRILKSCGISRSPQGTILATFLVSMPTSTALKFLGLGSYVIATHERSLNYEVVLAISSTDWNLFFSIYCPLYVIPTGIDAEKGSFNYSSFLSRERALAYAKKINNMEIYDNIESYKKVVADEGLEEIAGAIHSLYETLEPMDLKQGAIHSCRTESIDQLHTAMAQGVQDADYYIAIEGDGNTYAGKCGQLTGFIPFPTYLGRVLE